MAAQNTTQTRRPIVVNPNEGEALWFNNDLLTFKATGTETAGAFVLVEDLARRGKVTPLHAHPDEEETFYVLEGKALLHVDGSERVLDAGSFASVPRGVPHAYLVTSEVARSLILITPGSGAMEAFFRVAGEPARERVLGGADVEQRQDRQPLGKGLAGRGAIERRPGELALEPVIAAGRERRAPPRRRTRDRRG
jgi:quercetin dioxygenase-like cupin family protein